MTKRAWILLGIAVIVWAVGIIYLLGMNRSPQLQKPQPIRRRHVKSVDITPDLINGYMEICKKGLKSFDPFRPYPVEEEEGDFRRIVFSSENVINHIKFKGYIIDERGNGKVFLEVAGEDVVQDIGDLIDGRYMIIYASSLGLIVVDVEKGGMYVIR